MTLGIANRRQFTARLGGVAAGVTTLGFPSLIRAASPNRSIRVGVIGTGVRGKYLIGNLPETARVTAICDCAKLRMAETLEPQGLFRSVLARFREADAQRCAQYQDYRRMLDREKLDAVIIATPDHHHTLAAMLALQAGLDVYLEKPLTVSIGEGRLLADMVRKTGRVLQVGSQQRTMAMNRFACEFIRDGGLGKISKGNCPTILAQSATRRFPANRSPLNWTGICFSVLLRSALTTASYGSKTSSRSENLFGGDGICSANTPDTL